MIDSASEAVLLALPTALGLLLMVVVSSHVG